MADQQLSERFGGRGDLELDEEWQRRESLQDLVDGGDANPSPAPGVAPGPIRIEVVAGVSPGQFDRRLGFHRPAAIGGAVERGVVQHDGYSIRGEADVEFNGLDPELHRTLHRFEGILGNQAGGTAVADDRVTGEIEEGVHAR